MRRALDWFFRDRRTGAIVIGQWPNLPLWLFAAAAVAQAVLRFEGVPGTLLRALALAALAWWAVDEVARGVNPWRRCLGAGVLLLAVLPGVWRLAGGA